jgi:hypothetical protein
MPAAKRHQEPRITREVVESSVIHAMGYDDDLALLEIEFVSGDIYRYHFVPRRVWNELRNAPSKGRYFANVVREKFPTSRAP